MSKYKGFGLAATALSAALAAGSAQAVNIATDGVGEVAIAPYYTAKNGWLTTINLTNTTDQAMVVKVRFREALNSRDSLDFIVGLSAYDVFAGVVLKRQADGKTVFVARDQANYAGKKSCIVPNSVATASELDPSAAGFGTTLLAESYGGDTNGDFGLAAREIEQDGGPVTLDRLGEGYIEFFVLGSENVPNKSRADAAEYYDGDTNFSNGKGTKTGPLAVEFHDCDQLNTAFNRNNVAQLAKEFGEPINALKFNVRLVNPARGVEAGYEATTLANFYNPRGQDALVTATDNAACTVNIGDQRDATPVDWRPDGTAGSCMNFVTEQESYAFLEPSLNNAYPEVANFFDDRANGLRSVSPGIATLGGGTDNRNLPNNVRGADAVAALLTRRFVYNEWSAATGDVNGAAFDENSDWVVTFPVKNFFVDSTGPNGYGSQQAIAPGVLDRDDSGKYEVGTAGSTFCVASASGACTYNTSRPESVLDGTTFTDIDGTGPKTALRITNSYAPFPKLFDGTSCLEVGANLYDRAEEEDIAVASGGVTVSPSPPTARTFVSLCNEVNVISFFGKSVLRSADAATLAGNGDLSLPNQTLNNAAFNQEAGWLSLDLNTNSGADREGYLAINNAPSTVVPATPGPGVDGYTQGAPVMGFVIKQRSFGPALVKNNYASAIGHSYRRTLTTTQGGSSTSAPAMAGLVGAPAVAGKSDGFSGVGKDAAGNNITGANSAR